MGDPKRFPMFAHLVAEYIPLGAQVADVAGGKGQLQAAMRMLGYKDIVSYDRRPKYARGRANYRYELFNCNSVSRQFDAVVAMHPDGGTDHALLYCLRRKVPGLICPCCVIPSATDYGGQRANYSDWCRHLESLVKQYRRDYTWVNLPIEGRKRVLVIKS